MTSHRGVIWQVVMKVTDFGCSVFLDNKRIEKSQRTTINLQATSKLTQSL